MPASEGVVRFIQRNNALLESIEDLLIAATNEALTIKDRDRSLSSAGHFSCYGLTRLHGADEELWNPLMEQQHKVHWDREHIAIIREPLDHDAPRAPVTAELLRLFRHPEPDEAAARIKQTDHLLEQTVGALADDPRAFIERAKRSVNELRVETCELIEVRVPQRRRIMALRSAAGVIAMANLSAATAEVHKQAWQVAPEILREATNQLQHLGHSLDSLPLLGLFVVGIIGKEAWAQSKELIAIREPNNRMSKEQHGIVTVDDRKGQDQFSHVDNDLIYTSRHTAKISDMADSHRRIVEVGPADKNVRDSKREK
jgi:hypothetical protein